MPKLGVNIDHVATIRQARRTVEPDPVAAAVLCELAGCDSITIHLREDRRHIQDRDVEVLRRTLRVPMNLEMAATDEMVGIALATKPEYVCLVPEKRQEVTTEGGLDVAGSRAELGRQIARLREGGIAVSLFIDPDAAQIHASKELGADMIELHTGSYAEKWRESDLELKRLVEGTALARQLGLVVNAGHGLTYWNVRPIAEIPEMHELNIGHSIVSRAVLVGMERAVREMKLAMSGLPYGA
ncbi:MAG: pyridoxine 5'-phosphate synthase [Candidatus Sericytochromatia bacterium]